MGLQILDPQFKSGWRLQKKALAFASAFFNEIHSSEQVKYLKEFAAGESFSTENFCLAADCFISVQQVQVKPAAAAPQDFPDASGREC